jgi:hypothetical protein
LFPGICRECPRLPGILGANYTEIIEDGGCPNVSNKHMPSFQSGKWFPDGDYMSSINLYTNRDQEGLKILYYFKIKNGDNKAF